MLTHLLPCVNVTFQLKVGYNRIGINLLLRDMNRVFIASPPVAKIRCEECDRLTNVDTFCL